MEEAAVLWSSRVQPPGGPRPQPPKGPREGTSRRQPVGPQGPPKKVWGMLNVGIMKYWMGDWTNFASVCY